MISDLVYGKDKTEGIVSIEVDNDNATIYYNDGKAEVVQNEYYLLTDKPLEGSIELDGKQHFRYATKFDERNQMYVNINIAKAKGIDFHAIWNPKEMFMTKNGYTYFKGIGPEDVSVLSFDIETNGIAMDKDSVVFLIASVFRKNGELQRSIHYDIEEWTDYVREKNPDILLGHNILGFDLPFLSHCSGDLNLGREGQPIKYAKNESEFRVDGHQSYTYRNALVHGREIVDTFFLALKYDIDKKYPSYGLKAIAKHEGLASPDRQYYDASKIGEMWDNPEEREKIIEYAHDDAEEALKLFDLMIPSYFYYTRSVPKSFQQVINSASGSQLNSMMVRSYLQRGHSIPKATGIDHFEGALSGGKPGVYRHVNKIDVASMYPSIIIKDKLYDREKDPQGHMLAITEYFTKERLNNKALAKKTKEKYYNDLQQAQKIIINSLYGFLGAPGLNYNSLGIAEHITREGRNILTKGIDWVEKNGFMLVNWDTDSFSYSTGKRLTKKLFKEHIDEVNGLSPEGIIWEDDGQYKAVLVVKTKNYALYDGEKITIKGSALKGTMKEKALQYFMKDVINSLIRGNRTHLFDIYRSYAERIQRVDNIKDWAAKKTITKAVLNPERTNEQKILDAIGSRTVKEGDKIYVFFKEDGNLSLVDDFDGKYSRDRLYDKLYNTLDIFNTVVDTSLFPNYSLASNRSLLQ